MKSIITKLSLFSLMAVLAATTFVAPVQAADEEETTYTEVSFAGMLRELSSTDVPTTIVVQENETEENYTVDIDEETLFGYGLSDITKMDDWITGDQIRVIGLQDDNTGVINATVVINLSMKPYLYRGLNGWITDIDEDDSTMTIQWNNIEHEVDVTEDTHMVAGELNPAELSDYEIDDRVRIRVERDSEGGDDATIIVLLRRGDEIYLKARTRGFQAELTDISGDDGDATLTLTLLENPHLQEGDVNNLVGVEGDTVTVVIDENTNFVRRFMGESDFEDLVVGDELHIVGRVNDDETITAWLIRNKNLWTVSPLFHLGLVTDVDSDSVTVEAYNNQCELATEDVIEILFDDETRVLDGAWESEFDEIIEGDYLRVRGVIDANASQIDAETVMIVPGWVCAAAQAE